MDTPLAAVVHKENEHVGGGKATVTMKPDQLKNADKVYKSMLQGFEKGNEPFVHITEEDFEHSCDIGKGVELWYIKKKANVHRRSKLILSEMIASDTRSLVAKFEESSASEQKDNETDESDFKISDPGLFSVLDTPIRVDRFWLDVYRSPRIPEIKSDDGYEEFNNDDENDGIKSENPVFSRICNQ